MSPRGGRGTGGGRRGGGRRGGRTAAKVLVALALIVGGAAVGAVAVIFGLVPGFRIRSPIERLGGDTAAVAADTLPRAAADDSAAADSVPLPPLADPGAAAGTSVVTAADSADGEAIFRGAGRCLTCHGATGEGVAGLGPNLRDDRWLAGDGSLGAIARAIRDGVSPPRNFPMAMPAYAGQLPEDAIARVAGYVYAISHPGAVRHDSLAVPADSVRPEDPPQTPGDPKDP